MRPVRLSIEGIKSFVQRETIEFETLIEQGIFGIFGKTGSGKSTILFCIYLALYYDNTFKKEDFINKKSLNAKVEFTFNLKVDNIDKTYEIVREFKQSTTSAYLYEVTAQSKLCISERTKDVTDKVKELIGIGLDDFKKCIALPQGEFAEFLNSKRMEKMNLVSRLFSLSDYSTTLIGRAKSRLAEFQSERDIMSGKLSMYENLTEESLAVENAALNKLLAEIKPMQKKAEILNAEINKINDTLIVNENFLKADGEYNKLKAQKADIDNKKTFIERAESLSELIRLTSDKDKNTKHLQGLYSERELNLKSFKELNFQTESNNKSCNITALKNELEKNTAQLSKLEFIQSDINIKAEKELKRKNLRLRHSAVKNEIITLNEEKSKLDLELEKIAERIKEISFESDILGDLNSLRPVLLKEEYKNNIEYFAKQKNRLQKFDKNNTLYKAVEVEIEDRLLYYKELLQDFDLKKIDIHEIAKNNADIKDRLKAAESQREVIVNKLAKVRENIALKSSQIEQITAEGIELKTEIDRIDEKLKSILGEQPFSEDTAITLKKQIEKTVLEIEHFEKNAEKLNNAINDNQTQNKIILNNIDIYEKRQNELQANICEFCDNRGIKADINLQEYNIFDNEKAEIKNQISVFEKQFIASEIMVKQLEKKVDLSVTSQILIAKKDEYSQLKEKTDVALSEISILKSDIVKNTRNLAVKKELITSYKKIEKSYNLVLKLISMVDRSQFMEFIAEEYLQEIAELASGLLLELTSGRYSLKYLKIGAGASEFYVSDNLDGGAERSAQTLSGGETFLVSLSLAVALSETIYSKSLRQIDFFFLDEGFGTLDNTLIDTVLNSLHKLKDTHFSIGLISHVQELKERISAKILVTEADENYGSKIEIIY